MKRSYEYLEMESKVAIFEDSRCENHLPKRPDKTIKK